MWDDERFMRVIDRILTADELEERWQPGKRLRIKYGVDVTAPFLHIGHAVNLWLMRQLQEQGHVVVFLIGDFTTRIGDPTGESQVRPIIPPETIEANAQEFIRQVSAVLRTEPEVFEVRRNSEWYEAMPVGRLVELLASVTHQQLIQRDMFQERLENDREIYMHELVYPVLQGYDSVMLGADLTIVGSDQLFNEKMGRLFQKRAGQAPQVVVTTRITMGTDGVDKQRKSRGNCVALTDAPRDKFGKLMSIPDELVPDYLEVYTALPAERVKALTEELETDPRGVKLALARAVVARYHGEAQAREEEDWFVRTFSRRQVPGDIPTVPVPSESTVLELLQAANARKPENERRTTSELRRLLRQGAVALDGQRLTDPHARVVIPREGAALRIGKKEWVRGVPMG
jgi:tyrosyl-tRNA synthetase